MNFKNTLYTKEDTIDLDSVKDCKGMILVLRENKLKEEFRKPEFQLWRATGGFGTCNYTVGTALYSTCLVDDEDARWERYDFIGILKPELVNQLGLEV